MPPPPTRRERYFGSYINRPVVVYRDRYDSSFWWWLLDRPRAERARWVYHHTGSMDPARYDAMVQADSGLQEEITALELEKVAPDPNYVPPGLESDLMYSDQANAIAYAHRPTPAGRFWFWFWLICGSAFFGWFIFVKRWPASPSTNPA
jgi:hypothetical protein